MAYLALKFSPSTQGSAVCAFVARVTAWIPRVAVVEEDTRYLGVPNVTNRTVATLVASLEGVDALSFEQTESQVHA